MSLQLEETLPCMESCETNLNSSLQIWGWIIEKGKAEYLDELAHSAGWTVKLT